MQVTEERPPIVSVQGLGRPALRAARRIGRAISGLLGRRFLGKPVGVWLLWVVVLGILAFCPGVMSDPGMWPYLVDPELLALVVVMGVQYSQREITVWRVQALDRWQRRPWRRAKQNNGEV